jgi:hypothetical protein
MHRSCRRRGFVLGLAVAVLVMGGPLGCGSEESKMDRGVVVEREVAAPESAKDLDMTEAERRAQEERQTEAKEEKEFDATQE